METRRIQKTGDMQYLYLPTQWCRKHSIKSGSIVGISENSSGSLVISPKRTEEELRSISILLDDNDPEIVSRLVFACYHNPLSSFNIRLNKGLTASAILRQKKIISTVSIEIDKNTISSESSVLTLNPDQLLRTMVKKIKNLTIVMLENHDESLVRTYEEEIDRSNRLIQKSVIYSFILGTSHNYRTIDLYYISLIARDLERLADHIIGLRGEDRKYLREVMPVIDDLSRICSRIDLKKNSRYPSYSKAIEFARRASPIENIAMNGQAQYHKRRIKGLLNKISEVLMDWGITNKAYAD